MEAWPGGCALVGWAKAGWWRRRKNKETLKEGLSMERRKDFRSGRERG